MHQAAPHARGCTSCRCRNRKGRQSCTSARTACGRRAAARAAGWWRRHAARSSPADANMRSRNRPAGPAKGSPARSSAAPGTSAISTSRDSGSPSRNTRLVAVARKAQPSKLAKAACRAAGVLAASARAWACANPGAGNALRPPAGLTAAARAGCATVDRVIGQRLVRAPFELQRQRARSFITSVLRRCHADAQPSAWVASARFVPNLLAQGGSRCPSARRWSSTW